MANSDQSDTQHDLTTQLTESVSEMARELFSADDVGATLQRVVNLAVETVAGCDFAGVFVLDGQSVTTPACTDPIVVEVDALQHRCDEGPCLDALHDGGTLYAEDLAEDVRWPQFGPLAAAVGVRSALALRLSSGGATGALNLYAREPRAFGVIDRGKGLILSALAGLAFSTAQAHEDEERRTDNLQHALVSRAVIGQAQGILMERERATADQAFDILRRASQHLNLKLRDVAQALVDTGESPQGPAPSPPPPSAVSP